MKKLAKSLLVVGSIAAAGTAAADWCDGFNPYLGVDAKWQHTEGKGAWKNLLPKNYWGGTVYLGGRFSDCWGLEVGYSQTQRKSRTHTFAANENFFGNGNTAGATINVRNRFTSWHLDLNGFWPLDDCWELIGSIGVGWVKPKLTVRVTNPGAPGTPTGFFTGDVNAINSIHGKNKAVFRLGVGTQYMVSDCVGIRGIARWETTSNIRVNGNFTNVINPETGTASTINYGAARKIFKDTFSLALGIFWKF